jgi:hypothetical protein
MEQTPFYLVFLFLFIVGLALLDGERGALVTFKVLL